MAAARGINQLLRRTLQNQSSVSIIGELFVSVPISSNDSISNLLSLCSVVLFTFVNWALSTYPRFAGSLLFQSRLLVLELIKLLMTYEFW